MNDYIVYYHTHSREGYEHTDYLCFVCASQEAGMILDNTETIHPVISQEGSRKTCSRCDVELNWINS